MKATHVANPVRVEAHQITKVWSEDNVEARRIEFWVSLSDGTKFLIDDGMIARYMPVPGDYLVIQEDGYKYVNPREVFERKYQQIGQRVLFEQDKETADFLRDLAQKIEYAGLSAELCTVVFGGLGQRVICYTRNSTLESIATLRMGEKLMIDAAMPHPTTT